MPPVALGRIMTDLMIQRTAGLRPRPPRGLQHRRLRRRSGRRRCEPDRHQNAAPTGLRGPPVEAALRSASPRVTSAPSGSGGHRRRPLCRRRRPRRRGDCLRSTELRALRTGGARGSMRSAQSSGRARCAAGQWRGAQRSVRLHPMRSREQSWRCTVAREARAQPCRPCWRIRTAAAWCGAAWPSARAPNGRATWRAGVRAPRRCTHAAWRQSRQKPHNGSRSGSVGCSWRHCDPGSIRGAPSRSAARRRAARLSHSRAAAVAPMAARCAVAGRCRRRLSVGCTTRGPGR